MPKLLLSAFALRTWGARIEAAVPPGSLVFVTAEEALAADGPCDADIAFMTREVTGKSSSNNPTPELAGFDAVVRKSPDAQMAADPSRRRRAADLSRAAGRAA